MRAGRDEPSGALGFAADFPRKTAGIAAGARTNNPGGFRIRRFVANCLRRCYNNAIFVGNNSIFEEAVCVNEQLRAQIQSELAGMGVSANPDARTDLVIDMELLDASFSTGKHKLRYEAAILLDERDKTVRMYEKTTESSAGVSFGMSGESSFQSGKTLMRKVKALQYGPEGKVFEFQFDLGAIPKTVRAAAEQNGWRFKTVILRKNAMR